MELVQEGDTKLWVHKGKITKDMDVFFNPAKEFDRDTSVEIVRIIKPRNFLDLFAASGARGIRIANEANVEVYLNDLNKKAIELMEKNSKLNNVNVHISNMEANKFLLDSDVTFDFIDIDPFGSPIYFIENAVRKLNNGGILAITATDVAPLFGSAPKRCLRRYDSQSTRLPFSYETGMRILIGAIQRIVSKFDKYAEPIFSFFGGYYYRSYLKVYRKNKSPNVGYLKYSDDLTREIYPIPISEIPVGKIVGPLYIGNLNKKEILDKINYESKTIDLLREECCKQPFYYTTTEIAKSLKVSEVKFSRLETLSNFSRTHFDPKGFRTNEDIGAIKELFNKK